MLHNWVGNIQDEVVAPSRKRVDHRLQLGEESYFKVLLVSVDKAAGRAGEIRYHLTSEQLVSPRGAGGGRWIGGSGHPLPGPGPGEAEINGWREMFILVTAFFPLLFSPSHSSSSILPISPSTLGAAL